MFYLTELQTRRKNLPPLFQLRMAITKGSRIDHAVTSAPDSLEVRAIHKMIWSMSTAILA